MSCDAQLALESEYLSGWECSGVNCSVDCFFLGGGRPG